MLVCGLCCIDSKVINFISWSHDYFQPDYESLVQYNKQTGGKSDLSLDLGRLLKFRPSKTENLEEAEGKSPSLFVDLQVRVVNSGFKPNRKKARQKSG